LSVDAIVSDKHTVSFFRAEMAMLGRSTSSVKHLFILKIKIVPYRATDLPKEVRNYGTLKQLFSHCTSRVLHGAEVLNLLLTRLIVYGIITASMPDSPV
jgi:hypothetical protein